MDFSAPHRAEPLGFVWKPPPGVSTPSVFLRLLIIGCSRFCLVRDLRQWLSVMSRLLPLVFLALGNTTLRGHKPLWERAAAFFFSRREKWLLRGITMMYHNAVRPNL